MADVLSLIPLASNCGFPPDGGLDGTAWAVVGVAVGLWFLLSSLAGDGCKAKQVRTIGPAGDRKRCGSCDAAHPGFASYCRKCGRKF